MLLGKIDFSSSWTGTIRKHDQNIEAIPDLFCFMLMQCTDKFGFYIISITSLHSISFIVTSGMSNCCFIYTKYIKY